MNTGPAPDIDAAMVLGMASTAIPFARSREAQAERWLRILRMHGEAGMALHELGVSEASLDGERAGHDGGAPEAESAVEGDVVAQVGESAARTATARGAHAVETRDVMMAVMDVYGSDFDHVLSAHGTGRDEVVQRLALQTA